LGVKYKKPPNPNKRLKTYEEVKVEHAERKRRRAKTEDEPDFAHWLKNVYTFLFGTRP